LKNLGADATTTVNAPAASLAKAPQELGSPKVSVYPISLLTVFPPKATAQLQALQLKDQRYDR